MPAATVAQAPDIADANEDAFAPPTFEDPETFAAFDAIRIDGKYFTKPMQDEILALIASSPMKAAAGRQFTCGSGDAVGDPVRISGNDTVTKALATTNANAKVMGFIRHKGARQAASSGSATTCYLAKWHYVTGLSGGTAGNPVYLTDAGGYAASAGTVSRVVGTFLTATTAILFASELLDWVMQNAGFPGVLSKGSNFTIDNNDHGKTYINSTAIKATIPASGIDPGKEFEFVVANASNFTIEPASGVTIYNSNDESFVLSGGYPWLISARVGDSVKIKCITTTMWVVTSMNGIWMP